MATFQEHGPLIDIINGELIIISLLEFNQIIEMHKI